MIDRKEKGFEGGIAGIFKTKLTPNIDEFFNKTNIFLTYHKHLFSAMAA